MIDVHISLSSPSPAGPLDIAAAIALALRGPLTFPDGTIVHSINIEETDA